MEPTTTLNPPAGHDSPFYDIGPFNPETEAAAAALRPYVPLGALDELTGIQREELSEADGKSARQSAVIARITEIKEQMRQLRIELKKQQAKKDEYYRTPLFPRSDACRAAIWHAAHQSRSEAIARGEAPRLETAEQCGARCGRKTAA
jgi:hypothetical protein